MYDLEISKMYGLQIRLTEWNRTHTVKFFLESTEINRPFSVMVRYPKSLSENIRLGAWVSIASSIESFSNGAMSIRSTYGMAKKGIIDIKISRDSPTYDPDKVYATLEWLSQTITT